MTADPSAFLTRFEGPAPETAIAKDLAKRALPVAPVLIALGTLWGLDGAISVAFAVAMIVVNFLLSAALMAWSGRVSLSLLMGAALFGFLIRLGLITGVFLLVKDMSWMAVVPFGITLVVTHLGLLIWETRYVSISLAHPGLKPETVKE